MPRPLKVFKTHMGFYDAVVASPSIKAAAEAFGARPTIFTNGFAALTQEPEAVTAALARPGQVLKRPHGQPGAYKADPDPIQAPKLTAKQRRAAKDADAERKHREAAEKRAQADADRKAKRQAKDELDAIEREEAQLRVRRQKLQKKFHLRSMK